MHYKLHLEPNLKTFLFEATADIIIRSKNSPKQVILNSFELEYKKIEIEMNDTDIEVSYSLDVAKQEITINLPDGITNEFKLKFSYTGEHNEKLAGFYRSKYFVDGKENFAVVTQFQANDARRAFPCFDVPGKKATYDIEFLVEKDLFTISNMPIKEQKDVGDKKLIIFERTPKMSSYLVFFGVGDFDYIEKSSKGRQYRVIGSPGIPQKHGEFSLDFGVRVVEFLEEYFDTPYPLPKLDQIATPAFAAGAMENWGAILYRENALLYYEGTTSQAQVNGILGVISHEIVHQWFGNLVSPKTWKYLWLNESFATFFGNEVVDQLMPERKTFEFFVQSTNLSRRSRSTMGVMDWDSMIATSPIEIVGDGEISFTAKTVPILYSKGGAILRQVQAYLGKDTFRDGLRSYFKKHAYGATISNYLWESLEEASGKPVNKIMESFVLQKGLPIIAITRNNSKLIINQRRFTYLDNVSDDLWNIPITVRVFKNNNELEIKRFILDKVEDEFDLGEFDEYKVNVDLTGFYRVDYPAEDLPMLGSLIKERKINAIDRVNIEDDLYVLLKAKIITLETYLNFLKYYDKETSHMPMINIAAHLFEIYNLIEIEEKKNAISVISTEFLDNLFDRIGYNPKEGEDIGISIIRGTLLSISVKLGSEKSLNYAMSQFDKIKAGELIDADLQTSVLAIAAAETNDFDWFIGKYDNPISEAEFISIISAMTSFTDLNLLDRIKTMIFDSIPSRNRGFAIAGISNNPKMRKDIWLYFIANLDSFEALNNFMFQGAIVSIISNSYEHLEDMEKFFEKFIKKKPRFSDAVEVGIEQLKINLQFKTYLN